MVVSAPGSYGKPRPGLVVQSDVFDGNGSLAVLLLTSELKLGNPLLRYLLDPSDGNGLLLASDVMIDKIFAIPRERMGKKIGGVTAKQMSDITSALALFLGLK